MSLDAPWMRESETGLHTPPQLEERIATDSLTPSSSSGVQNVWAHRKRVLYTTGAETDLFAVNFKEIRTTTV